MSGTNYRTWQTYHVGHFLVTVQLDPVADAHSALRHNELAEVTRQLIEVMETNRLPATWAVSDPAHSAATPFILRSAVEHEFAILGDANWIGPLAGRTRFARELTRRVAQSRAAGIEVHSLVPRAASIERNIDLVVKQQITAVAGSHLPQPAARQIATPRALHYGVWELPITSSLPQPTTWLSTGAWSTWRRIRRAAKDAAMFHLVLDAPSICNEGRRARSAVAWLMRRVAALRDRGLVGVETLHAAATRLAAVPNVKPQQSILRRAA
jgi:hypothetical protein